MLDRNEVLGESAPLLGRVTCIAAAGPLLHRCCDQKAVCASLLSSLLDAAGSSDEEVRKAGYRALRGCMLLRKETMQASTSKLVDAFFKGLSDPCSEVASDSSCILLHILEQDCLDQATVAQVASSPDTLPEAPFNPHPGPAGGAPRQPLRDRLSDEPPAGPPC